MLSYYYVCNIHEQLRETQLEDYEVNNGMSAVWIEIHQAIMHNRQLNKVKEPNSLPKQGQEFGLYH